MEIHLPLDHESWVEYRALKAAVGGAVATYLLVKLFVDLGYQAQSGRTLGVLDEKAVEYFSKEVRGHDPESRISDEHPHQLLVEAGFLEAVSGVAAATPYQGVPYRCERFVRLNKHLDPAFKPMHRKGTDMSAFVRKNRKSSESLMQGALLIPPEVWEKAEGGRLSHEEIADVMMLIRGCDNALGRPERPSNENGFTQELVRAAYHVLKQLPTENVDLILRTIVKARGNPAIPTTTEQLLGVGPSGKMRFEELAGVLLRN